jgi:nicotinamide-nucleotide amidase
MTTQRSLEIISAHLTEGKESIAIAESVTAGLLTNAFSRSLNATRFLQGGIIVYNLGQKTKHLHVNPIHAEETNSVSPEIAIQMAAEVSRYFCCQWGIGITGYAAPVPALKIKTCFAYFAIVRNGTVFSSGRIETHLKGEGRVQQYFVDTLLRSFSQAFSELK